MFRTIDNLEHWRKIWRNARNFSVNLPERQWCNLWHHHFDWDENGKKSRFEHRRYIRPLLHAFTRAQKQLANQPVPYQVFVLIREDDPGSDALYIHTANPHSALPKEFGHLQYLSAPPPLLLGLVSADKYRIGKGESSYVVFPK